MVIVETLQPFRTLGAIHLRKKRVLEKLAESGQAWRAGEDEESFLESLRPKNPKCFKCNLGMQCPMCNRDECFKCGAYLKCPKCAGLVKGNSIPNGGTGDSEVRGFVETRSSGTQYNERDFKKQKTKAQLRAALGTDQEAEEFGDNEKDEKELRIEELEKQIDDLGAELGRAEEERDRQEERAEVYRDKFNEMRKDWDIEQKSRVKLEGKLADFQTQLRYLSDVAAMYQSKLTQTRIWTMTTIEKGYDKMWETFSRYGKCEARAMRRLVLAAWRSGIAMMKLDKALAESEKRCKLVEAERDKYKEECVELKGIITQLEEIRADMRRRLKAAGKRALDKVLHSKPGGQMLQYFELWRLGHAAAVAENRMEHADDLARELQEWRQKFESAFKRVNELTWKLTEANRKVALREREAEKLRPLVSEVASLKRKLIEVEEARIRQIAERDAILIERRKELQELQQVILNDVHAQALHAHILHLNDKIEYEKMLRMRATGTGFPRNAPTVVVCMNCQKLLVYRKKAKMSVKSPRKKKTCNEFLPPLKSSHHHNGSDSEDGLHEDSTHSGGRLERSLMSYSSDPESETSGSMSLKPPAAVGSSSRPSQPGKRILRFFYQIFRAVLAVAHSMQPITIEMIPDAIYLPEVAKKKVVVSPASREGAEVYRTQADLFHWRRLGCFKLSENDQVAVSGEKDWTIKDRECVAAKCDSGKSAEETPKCRSGLPFYRFKRGADCKEGDCLDLSTCQLRCMMKGMDVAGLVYSSPIDKNPDEHLLPNECRCGASRKNPIWNNWQQNSLGQPQFDTIEYLLPPEEALEVDEVGCSVEIWEYADARETGGAVPNMIEELNADDEGYQLAVVLGMADPGDMDDTTVEEDDKRSKAAETRSKTCTTKKGIGKSLAETKTRLRRSSTGIRARLPFDNDKDDHGELYSKKTACEGVVEDTACWSFAMQSTGDSKCTADQWGCSISYFEKNHRSKVCQDTRMLSKCPITCGVCRLYNRPGPRAGSYATWSDNKEQSGFVRIPYVIDRGNPHMDASRVAVIEAATKAMADNTCIQFYEFDDRGQLPNKFVKFTVETGSSGEPAGCYASPPGHPSSQFSVVNLGSCRDSSRLGSVIHELGHVLGMVHTQMRGDRDEYIDLNWKDIKPGSEANFAVDHYSFQGADGEYVPYDYGSLLHYSKTQAMDPSRYDPSRNPGTFEVKYPVPEGLTKIGQRERLSDSDITEINKLYRCYMGLSKQEGKREQTMASSSANSALSSAAGTPAPLSTEDFQLSRAQFAQLQNKRKGEIETNTANLVGSVAQSMQYVAQTANGGNGRLTEEATQKLIGSIKGIIGMFEDSKALGHIVDDSNRYISR
ncbi:hypothetical protein FOL47_007342 [Perkinsus chesapeaki]|uniref:Metalloendopeptidase n=1 Tax=Perkinsus chesapeaki TaxID=330153 RepID=A0A7J6MXX9_PERCH|nr:hypothetical protein FOL47_007342 [Perkinsus chesapeaki]